MDKQLQILLIDDHPMFLDGMDIILKQQNIDVLTAANVQDALGKVDKNAKIDLIFVDLNLPGLDGYAFITALRERQVFTPVVILSASENHHDIVRALQSGAMGYLPKSIEADRIIEAIDAVLAGEVYVAPELDYEIPESGVAKKTRRTRKSYYGKISPRQLDILNLVSEGYSNKEIALAINVAEVTIKYHLNAVFGVLKVKNRTACVKRAQELGLLEEY